MRNDLWLQLITFAVMIAFVYAVYRLQCWLRAGVPESLCDCRFSMVKPEELNSQLGKSLVLATRPKVAPELKKA